MTRNQARKPLATWTIFLVIGMMIASNLPVSGEPLILTKPSMNKNSPLKQFKSGIKAKDIICREGLQLVTKLENSMPACVKPSTASKLVLSGWGKILGEVVTSLEESSTKTITLDDNGKSITLKEGESFVLKLGENFDWAIDIDDQTVVSRQINIMVIRGSQGVYNAHHAGTATLTGVGDPLCLKAEVPCKIHSILFTLNITVTPASEDVNSDLSISTDKDKYVAGEKVEITITNTGKTRVFPSGWGYSITGIDGKHYAPNGVLNMMLVSLPPGNSTHWTWDQTDENGVQANAGKYHITGSYNEDGTEKTVTNFKEIEILSKT